MYMMKPSAIVILLFLIMCFHSSESKLQQQSSVNDDDDDDDWDEDEDEDDSYLRPEVDDDGRIYKNPRNSPSAMCPRDEEQAELLSQKCLRKCSTDEDCKSKKKKCRCDGACGMSCIKPDRECPELTDIQHGVMMVTGKLFGDRVHYTCDHGYFIVGLSERTCRADGHWTGTSASCKKEANSFCSDPPKINNARHNALMEQTTFDLDNMVQYFCNHGYVTTGFPKAKCLMMDGAASWFGPDIACEPQNCGAPTDIANGWHAGECYTFDCRVSYHCADGYELVGRAEKTCLADGTWAPKELPQCVQVTAVQCPPPENPRYGKAVYTSCAYNSIVSYECKYSFTIVGPATRRCGADGRWSGQAPVCKEINCGSPGILYNGWIENIESGTGLGASIIFRCNDHMKLEGNTSSVCQIDGKWRYPLPQCLAPCVVPQIENGHIMVASRERDHINNVTVVEHGERLIVQCVQNYEFAANSTPVICNNGTWSIIPTCSPARCKQMPKTPKNGIVIAPKTDHGMRAVFMCKDGFELVGGDNSSNSTIFVECRYGNWTGEMPHCIEVYCPFPGYITNGKVLLVGNMGVYDYRPYVRKVVNNKQIMYDCNRGYVLSEGPPGATCIGGNWSPKQLPKCIPGQHPRLRWSRRRRRRRSMEETRRKKTGTVSYEKFADFFKKISKRVLHLQMGRANDRTKHGVDSGRSLTSNGNLTVRGSRKKYSDHKNHTRVRDERMIDFLKIVYQKLVRIDSEESNNGTNLSTHGLLNAMSRNFFHVNLEELLPMNSSTLSEERREFRAKDRRELVKLKRDFVRFYNRSKDKHDRKGARRRDQRMKMRNKKKRSKCEKYKSMYYYKDFYKFINNYVNEKLAALEAQNATEELIQKMNIDKFTIRNGTVFTIREIYAFFKHIIEKKLNSTEVTNETILETAQNNLEAIDNQTTSSTTSQRPVLNNEIPSMENVNGVPKHRSKRIRKTSEKSVSSFRRKLLSLSRTSNSLSSKPKLVKSGYRISHSLKSKQFIPNELEAQQQSRSKRFLSPSKLDNQIFQKNLYLNACEDGFTTNVKRSILETNRTSWTALRRRKGDLEEHENK